MQSPISRRETCQAHTGHSHQPHWLFIPAASLANNYTDAKLQRTISSIHAVIFIPQQLHDRRMFSKLLVDEAWSSRYIHTCNCVHVLQIMCKMLRNVTQHSQTVLSCPVSTNRLDVADRSATGRFSNTMTLKTNHKSYVISYQRLLEMWRSLHFRMCMERTMTIVEKST